MIGTANPTRSPTAPAALAAPSHGHQLRGTPYAVIGSTTHFAFANTEMAENPTRAAPITLTTTYDVDMPYRPRPDGRCDTPAGVVYRNRATRTAVREVISGTYLPSGHEAVCCGVCLRRRGGADRSVWSQGHAIRVRTLRGSLGFGRPVCVRALRRRNGVRNHGSDEGPSFGRRPSCPDDLVEPVLAGLRPPVPERGRAHAYGRQP